MGKVRTMKNINLIPAYVILAVAFLLFAMFIADFEREYIEDRQMCVAHKYTSQVETFNDHWVWDKENNRYAFTEEDSWRIRRLDFFSYIFPHMAYICSTFLAALVYYHISLKKPLHILSNAANRIANNDLDFVISYNKDDEFGKLCRAFEKMRSCLEDNSRATWRQIEERKRLNASFSHDMRTPLTVLEGNLDILLKYRDSGQLSADDITEIYAVIYMQLKRLHRYVDSMNQLQRLEDIEISIKSVNREELLKTLKNTAEIICSTKSLTFHDNVQAETVCIDLEIVLQVFENILFNAIRYADCSVEVMCEMNDRRLSIAVSDDGPGFNPETIKFATDPFYTTEKKSEGQHFGLGLNISKMLCQRHGGDIELQNLSEGGACVIVSFGSR